MRKFTLIFSLIIVFSSFGNNDKKYERTLSRADYFYEHFSFQKAIDLYKEALEIKESQEPKVQIANCYLKINQPENALKWYEEALKDGELSDQDMLHYGQVLSALERYDEASEILDKHQHAEKWVEGRSAGFKQVGKFYHNEIAYDISAFPFNTEYADFSPTIMHNKNLVFVTGRPHSGWFKSRYNADKTLFLNLFEVADNEEPVKLQRGISTRFHEGPAQFYFYDERIIFTRNNYNNQEAKLSTAGINGLKMFISERHGTGRWSKPEEFPYNSDEYSVGHPSLTPDVQTLYFASDMPGGYGGVDIYKCIKKNGKWAEPENLGPTINTARNEMFPFVSKNGFLYFSSDGHEGIGGLDVFRIDLQRPNAKPRNMGFAMNTNADDFGITLDLENGNEGYFSSNRAGGAGGDDIYKVFMYDHIIKVNLRDDETKELIVGDLEAFDPFMKEKVRDQTEVSTIMFPALSGDIFEIDGSSPGYLPDSLKIELGKDSRDLRQIVFDVYLKKPGSNAIVYVVEINHESQQVLYLQKDEKELVLHAGNYTSLQEKFEEKYVAVDSVIYLNNVLYDFDKHNIREDARASLDKWVVFLNQYPDEKISLSAHTDARGTNKYNERLAKRRVKAAVNYLVDAGISKDRFVERSFGEEELWETCPEQDCDEVQHQNNRRTEVLIRRE